jgi:hypothetical protein
MKKNIVCGLLALICIACSAGKSMEAPHANSYDGVSTDSGIVYSEAKQAAKDEAGPDGAAEFMQAAVFGENTASGGTAAERKLVQRANLRLRVEDLAASDAAVNALMECHGAYAASTEREENSRSYLIRVPRGAYKAFLAAMDGMGRTLYRSESAEDVTLRYYDLEGRLATRQELLKTFQSYLAKAKDIEEILSVESRIADLQSEIDGTGTEFRRLANLVDFATVALDIYGPAASTAYAGPTFGERITALFSGFGDFVSTVVVVLVGVVIYGIPLLLVLALLFWLSFGRIGLMKKLWRIAAGTKGERDTKSG